MRHFLLPDGCKCRDIHAGWRGGFSVQRGGQFQTLVVVEGRSHVGDTSDLFGNHPHLFVVDHAVDESLVAEVYESQVLHHDRKEGDGRILDQFDIEETSVL